MRVDVSAHDLVRTETCIHPGCGETADVEDYCFFHARTAAPEAPPVEPAATETPLWSREQIIAAILAWKTEHGAPPVSTDWASAAPGRPSAGLVKRRFGSWANAIVAAGFERPTRGGRPGGTTAQKPKAAPAEAKRAPAEPPRKSAAGPIPEPFRKPPDAPGAPVVDESSTSLVKLAGVVEQARRDVCDLEDELAQGRAYCADAEQALRDALDHTAVVPFVESQAA